MKRAVLAVAALAALVATIVVAPDSRADDVPAPYPVSYNFLLSAVTAGTQVDADPPGANLWGCKPSRSRPRPVVLVHGTAGNKNTNWQTYAPLLANNGFCVFSLTYGVAPGTPLPLNQLGGMTRIQDSAEQLKRFVAKVLRETGARKVDLIGHSQGTYMPEYWVKFLGGARFVKRYVSLAPLWHGTDSAGSLGELGKVFGFDEESLPICNACGQMSADSRFLKRLRRGGLVVGKIEYTNIMTKHDQLVRPYTSGREPGMRNIVVQDKCRTDYAEHFEIASDPVAAQVVLNTLDPANRRPVPCMVVLPYIGPAGG